MGVGFLAAATPTLIERSRAPFPAEDSEFDAFVESQIFGIRAALTAEASDREKDYAPSDETWLRDWLREKYEAARDALWIVFEKTRCVRLQTRIEALESLNALQQDQLAHARESAEYHRDRAEKAESRVAFL